VVVRAPARRRVGGVRDLVPVGHSGRTEAFGRCLVIGDGRWLCRAAVARRRTGPGRTACRC
jgi:hypothetical protein